MGHPPMAELSARRGASRKLYGSSLSPKRYLTALADRCNVVATSVSLAVKKSSPWSCGGRHVFSSSEKPTVEDDSSPVTNSVRALASSSSSKKAATFLTDPTSCEDKDSGEEASSSADDAEAAVEEPSSARAAEETWKKRRSGSPPVNCLIKRARSSLCLSSSSSLGAVATPPPPVNVIEEEEEEEEESGPWWSAYEAVGVLGRGSFGTVSLLAHSQESSMDLLALKSIAYETLATRRKVDHALEERATLELLRGHPNVLTLMGAWRTDEAVHLLTPCYVGGELFQHLQKRKCFEVDEVRFIAAELSAALVHTHAHWVIYRDLKPENVLFDARGHVVLADFGLAMRIAKSHAVPTRRALHSRGAQALCGTPEYMAPEVLEKRHYGTAVDWWSLGVVVAELATGLPPWYTADRVLLFDRIRHAPLELRHALPKSPDPPTPEALQLAAFVAACLRRDVHNRIGDATVRDATFFASLLRPHSWANLQNLDPPFNPMMMCVDGAASSSLLSPRDAVARHFDHAFDDAADPTPADRVRHPPPPPPQLPPPSSTHPLKKTAAITASSSTRSLVDLVTRHDAAFDSWSFNAAPP